MRPPELFSETPTNAARTHSRNHRCVERHQAHRLDRLAPHQPDQVAALDDQQRGRERRHRELAGLGLFAVANLVSAFAPNVATLQVGRGLAGAAAALAQPATLALLLHATKPERRPHAIAAWTAALGIGGMVGNLVAGVVLRWWAWEQLFAVFVPVAVILLAGVAAAVPKAPKHDANVDPIGTTVLTGGLFALLYGIIEGPEKGWTATGTLVTGFAILPLAIGMGLLLLSTVDAATPYPLYAAYLFVIAVGMGAKAVEQQERELPGTDQHHPRRFRYLSARKFTAITLGRHAPGGN